MKLTVKYFASMRERMGRGEQVVDTVESELTVSQLWQQYLSKAPLPANTLIAVNMEYCDGEMRLNEGDEVAFFPLVTGG